MSDAIEGSSKMRLNDCWPWQGQKPDYSGFKRECETGIYPKVYLHTYEAAYVQLLIVILCVKIINIGNTVNAYPQKTGWIHCGILTQQSTI